RSPGTGSVLSFNDPRHRDLYTSFPTRRSSDLRAFGAVDDDAGTEHAGEIPRHGETESHPGLAVGAVAGAVEGFEDARLLVGGDPDSRVAHGEHDAPVRARRAELDAATRRVLHGIGREVRDDLAEPLRVAADPLRTGLDFHLDTHVLGPDEGCGQLLHPLVELGDVNGLVPDRKSVV